MIDGGCVGMGDNNGWEVVIELVDKLWGIDDPKVKDVVGWAEEKLGEIGCSADGENGERESPREVRDGLKGKQQSSPDLQSLHGADNMTLKEKSHLPKRSSATKISQNPGLEAAFLRHALAAESVLERADVRTAMLNALDLYENMKVKV